MADATQQVFQLETKIKESAHKIDRLHDYEERIEQLTAVQGVWYERSCLFYIFFDRCFNRNDDARKYREQKDEMAIMVSNFKKMQLQVQAYQAQMEDLKRCRNCVCTSRNATQRLYGRTADERAFAQEESIANLHRRLEQPPQRQTFDFSAYTAEKATLSTANKKLKEEVEDLRDEVERLQGELEMSKAALARSEV